MKVLYYKVKLRQIRVMVNEGFIIAYFEKNKLIKVEGVFTLDYLCAYNINGNLHIEYYENEPCSTEERTEYNIFKFVLDVNKISFPLNMTLNLNNLKEKIQILTMEEIKNSSKQKRCIEKVNQFVEKILHEKDGN